MFTRYDNDVVASITRLHGYEIAKAPKWELRGFASWLLPFFQPHYDCVLLTKRLYIRQLRLSELATSLLSCVEVSKASLNSPDEYNFHATTFGLCSLCYDDFPVP
jgi:hypothetical protein